MLTPEEIRENVWGLYPKMIGYTNEHNMGQMLKDRGISIEELVNESVIAVFDNLNGFDSVSHLESYIKKAIDSAGSYIYETLKNDKFVSHYLRGEDGNENYDRGIIGQISYEDAISSYAHSSAFIQMYDIFESIRFSESRTGFYCHACGSTKHYNINNDRKCSGCGTFYSLTSKTNLHGLKIGYQKFYKFLMAVLSDIKISSYKLSKLCGVTQTTANLRKRLIISASVKAESTHPDVVLKELLMPKCVSKLELANDILTPAQVSDIRTLYLNGTSRKELCKMFGRSIDSIGDIVICKSYNKGEYASSVYDYKKCRKIILVKEPQQKSLSNDRLEIEVSIDFSSGFSLDKLSAKFNIAVDKIYDIIRNSRYLDDDRRIEITKNRIANTLKQLEYV